MTAAKSPKTDLPWQMTQEEWEQFKKNPESFRGKHTDPDGLEAWVREDVYGSKGRLWRLGSTPESRREKRD